MNSTVSNLWNQIENQEQVKRTLSKARTENRLAQVMIFSGPTGGGKRATALALAQNLLCAQPVDGLACGICGDCTRVEKLAHESVLIVEPDKGQIKVEQARAIRDWTALQNISKARLVLLDPADWISVQAANSLLKLLEEPPPATFFVLTSTMPAALPGTIRSRAQLIRFRPPLIDELSDMGEEKIALHEQLDRWLKASMEGVASPESVALRDSLQERENQVWAVKYLLRQVAEALRGKANLLSQVRHGLVDLAEDFAHLEHDLTRGFDRTLVMESLSLKLYRTRTGMV